MSRSLIFEEIDVERTYQQARWGDEADDTLNTPWMWAAYIAHYATAWMAGTFMPLEASVVHRFRGAMIKVAALAIAAVESIDRQRSTGKTFYEE